MVFLKEIFKKVEYEKKKNQKTTKKCMQNSSVGKELKKTIGFQILEYVFAFIFAQQNHKSCISAQFGSQGLVHLCSS